MRRSYLAYQSNYFQGITGGGASHAPGTPLIYHIKQSIAKKSARFSAKLSSRYNRGRSVPRSRLAFYLSYQAKHCEEVISHISQISSGHNQPAAARRIKQSIAKKSARFSAKLSSRHNRGGASRAPGSPFIYHIKPSIAKKLSRISVKLSSRYNRGGASHAP